MQSAPLNTRIVSSDFDQFASQLAMEVWNYMAQSPQFRNLQPKDYPALLEALERTLKPYCVVPEKS